MSSDSETRARPGPFMMGNLGTEEPEMGYAAFVDETPGAATRSHVTC